MKINYRYDSSIYNLYRNHYSISCLFFKKIQISDDFVMGGRKIPGFALALSERAAGESSWLLLGLTGLAFAQGLTAIWVALGCVIGILFIWWVMADRLRKLSIDNSANTIPSLFAKRFPQHAFGIQMLSSVILIFFFLLYMAAQYSGAGKVLRPLVCRNIGQFDFSRHYYCLYHAWKTLLLLLYRCVQAILMFFSSLLYL